MSPDPLFATVRAWVAACYPGAAPATITIRLADGRIVRLPVPSAPPGTPGVATTPSAGSNVRRLSRHESDIVEAMGSDWLVGKQIASRVELPYNSTLRMALAGMVERGILEKGPQGYHVVPGG